MNFWSSKQIDLDLCKWVKVMLVGGVDCLRSRLHSIWLRRERARRCFTLRHWDLLGNILRGQHSFSRLQLFKFSSGMLVTSFVGVTRSSPLPPSPTSLPSPRSLLFHPCAVSFFASSPTLSLGNWGVQSESREIDYHKDISRFLFYEFRWTFSHNAMIETIWIRRILI